MLKPMIKSSLVSCFVMLEGMEIEIADRWKPVPTKDRPMGSYSEQVFLILLLQNKITLQNLKKEPSQEPSFQR